MCMKAMLTSNLRYAWSVKVVNHFIWVAHISSDPQKRLRVLQIAIRLWSLQYVTNFNYTDADALHDMNL